MIQVFKLICFGENKVENVQRIVVPTGAPGCRRRARLSAPFVRVLRSQFRVLLSTLLHGLSTPTQVINRKKSVNGGRAANSPGVAAAWRTPQACPPSALVVLDFLSSKGALGGGGGGSGGGGGGGGGGGAVWLSGCDSVHGSTAWDSIGWLGALAGPSVDFPLK